jgi:hypothetical protein
VNLYVLYVAILVFALSIGGYVYASSIQKKNTSRLKKEQKTQMRQKRTAIQMTSHALVAISIILFVVFLIQNSNKYGMDKLNYKAAIKVTQDRDYGSGHTDSPVNYEMKFPTSGPHSPHDLKFGFYKEKPPIEKLVHNMEHGDILIYYRSDMKPEVMERIKYLTNFQKAGSGVLSVPSEDIPADVGVWVTAWTKTLQLTTFDEAQIGTFIYENINRGPETIPPSVRGGGGTM